MPVQLIQPAARADNRGCVLIGVALPNSQPPDDMLDIALGRKSFLIARQVSEMTKRLNIFNARNHKSVGIHAQVTLTPLRFEATDNHHINAATPFDGIEFLLHLPCCAGFVRRRNMKPGGCQRTVGRCYDGLLEVRRKDCAHPDILVIIARRITNQLAIRDRRNIRR